MTELEERNRLAARIHDEIGHGMTGSVMLLEGADAVMDSDPARARETVRRVTENLRESVEVIRRTLREERIDADEVNLAKIKSALAEFEVDYPQISTEFTFEGDFSPVSGAVFACIYENMIEAMTNTMKHSHSTVFRVALNISKHLLRAELSDNGNTHRRVSSAPEAVNTLRSGEGDIPVGVDRTDIHGGGAGIGLQVMEERCALCLGRCFFRDEPDGFHIIMTFPLRDVAV
jgi:signal transduction histidine kinase